MLAAEALNVASLMCGRGKIWKEVVQRYRRLRQKAPVVKGHDLWKEVVQGRRGGGQRIRASTGKGL